MTLVTDTNILIRCSRGTAMRWVEDLRSRGVRLVTTDRNLGETFAVLTGKLGLPSIEADQEVDRLTDAFGIVPSEDYDHFAEAALARLRPGGKSDWPVVAAAMALEAGIWSEDVDFFGVGIPIWTTGNIGFVTPSPDEAS